MSESSLKFYQMFELWPLSDVCPSEGPLSYSRSIFPLVKLSPDAASRLSSSPLHPAFPSITCSFRLDYFQRSKLHRLPSSSIYLAAAVIPCPRCFKHSVSSLSDRSSLYSVLMCPLIAFMEAFSKPALASCPGRGSGYQCDSFLAVSPLEFSLCLRMLRFILVLCFALAFENPEYGSSFV